MPGRRKFLKQTVAGLALGSALGKALAAADQAMEPPPRQTIDHFTPTPLWLRGKAVNQWVSIANTSMDKMDFSAQIAAGRRTAES